MLANRFNQNASTKNSTSRIEFLEKFDKLPSEVQMAIDGGSLKLTDEIVYSVKNLAGSTQKELMEASDTQSVGVTNINNRKLEALRYLLVKKIRLVAVDITTGDVDDAAIANAKFTKPNDAILNGEIEVTISGKVALPRMSCRVFEKDATATDGLSCTYDLDNPFLICPMSEITPTLRIPNSSSAAVAKTVVRIEFIGTMVIPA